MKKAEVFELIVKAFGVYLLVLAIIALPTMLQGIIMLAFYLTQGPWGGTGDAMGEMMTTLKTTYMSSSLAAVIRFVIYIVASISFLRSGSWVRKLIGRAAGPDVQADGGDAAA